jgi:glycosyltransferase involved in cell wall biosynthesis
LLRTARILRGSPGSFRWPGSLSTKGTSHMNVLVIGPQPFFAERGTPIAVRRLVETLCADGHDVDLLTYPFGEDIHVEGLTIHRGGRFPGVRGVGIGFSLGKLLSDLMLLPRLYRLCRPGHYDVVHAVEESIYAALLLRWRHRARVIYDMDSSLAEQLVDSHALFRPLLPVLRRIEEWAIQSAEVVTPMCRDLAAYAATLRATHDDVVVLHDVPVEAAGASRGSEQPSSNGAGPQCLALYVGNLEPYQGIDLLVDAAALLPRDSSLRIQVVGGPVAAVERFRKKAAERGAHDRIQFLGPRPLAHLHDLLAAADILLSPRTKGYNTPLKLYSYMESGRPILATRLRTHTQVLDDSTALLAEPEAGAYAEGLVRLAADEDLRRKLGEAAERHVRREYSPTSFSSRVRAIYDQSHPRPSRRGAAYAASTWTGVERRSGGDRRSPSRSGMDRRLAECQVTYG